MTRSDPAAIHWLRAGELGVGVSTETGAVVAMRHGDWGVLDRAELGRSFRLLVPTPDRRANFIDGRQQGTPICLISEDGRTVTSAWNDVVDEHGAAHLISVQTQITAHEDRIVFAIELDNTSDLVVENVYFPDLGDIRPAPSGRLDAFTYVPGTLGRYRSSIWPTFRNEAGYWGVDHPTFHCGSHAGFVPMNPMVPWMLLEDGSLGLYVGVDEPSAEPVTWFAELLPGYDDSITWRTLAGGRVPAGEAIGGHTVGVHFAAVHLPYLAAGERRALTPIAVAAYTGDWHAGADRYIRRRAAWGRPCACPPAWARDPHSWLQLQLKSQESERRVSFAELPEIAAECARHGVTAIQVVGWTEGGQDGNMPSHNPDQQLGGAEALRGAIAACQRLGVKIVLYTKFTWADRTTERFHRELISHAVKDPYGDYYQYYGYRYQTITQLLDINTHRLVPMCFLSERYLKICQEEFANLVNLGADGMLYDEAMWHGSSVCFDESHQHRLGAPVFANDREFVSRLRQTPGLPGDYLFACEAPYDLEWEAYHLGYIRSSDPDYLPVNRYLRPDGLLMTAVIGFDDRNMINQCLLYRYVISYEPFNFKGRLSDAPDTVAYGQRMDQLRVELRDWFWDANFIDTVGVAVRKSNGAAHHPYAAFRHRDGRTAVAIANYSDEPIDGLSVRIDGQSLPMRYRLVDDPEWHPVNDDLAIPPRSAAVLIPVTAVPSDQ
ncbi:hypothetical protein GGD63_008175 [Bradyrhizobium sp. cir1]|uniref:DUF6259 domain-containing protein n=1 Tax=Bradyrhizobium sp. cir1 TaxID=1445730 RepID=UPI0016067B28|nr:DUF6259 domain-containing protein [Bradyrhizobium sp. cir1]MBB4375326.1 hypothetical protein [Bradyrhizobium sp. cir1]